MSQRATCKYCSSPSRGSASLSRWQPSPSLAGSPMLPLNSCLGSSSHTTHRHRTRRRLTNASLALVTTSLLSMASGTMATSDLPSERATLPDSVLSPTHHIVQVTNSDLKSTGSVSIALVRTGLMYVILYSTLASLLFVLASVVALKHGIASHRRRLPTAWVVGLAMILGLVGSILNTVFWALMLANELTSPERSASFWVATSSMLFITPLVAHVALILRLSDLHPPTLASSRKRFLIIAFPIIMTLVRIAAIIVYHVQGHADVRRDGFLHETDSKEVGKYALVEQVAALAQLLYTSAVLAYKFHQLGKGQSSSKDFMNEDDERWTFRDVYKGIQQAIYATAFSFAFSTLYQIGIVACRASSAVSGNNIGYILVANVYVQVLGAVLATLSSSHRWREDRFAGTFEPGDSIVRRSSKGETDSAIALDTHAYTATTKYGLRPLRHVSTCGCDCASLSINTDTNDGARRRSNRRGHPHDPSDVEEGLETVNSNHLVDAYAQRSAGRRPQTSDSDATRSCIDAPGEKLFLSGDSAESKSLRANSPSLNLPSRHRPGTGDSATSKRSESENYAAPRGLDARDLEGEKRRSSDMTLFPAYANAPWTVAAPPPPPAASSSVSDESAAPAPTDAPTLPPPQQNPIELSPKSTAFQAP